MNNKTNKHLDYVNSLKVKTETKHDWKDDLFIASIIVFIGWVFIVALLATP